MHVTAEVRQPSEERLAAFREGRRAWPEIALELERFCEHLEQLGYARTLPRHASALYLCAACLYKLPAACQVLERDYLVQLHAPLRRILVHFDRVEDVLQEVRYRLIVQRSPKIASYRGDGPIAHWLRVVALHIARDQQRSELSRRRKRDASRTWAASIDAGQQSRDGEDARLELARERSFNVRLGAALRELPSAERQLLRHYFVYNLGIDTLGPMYGVHRSTIARRIRRTLMGLRGSLQAAAAAGWACEYPVDAEDAAPRRCELSIATLLE